MTTTATEPAAGRAATPLRERFWFQAVVVVLALAAFAVVATRLVHRDVVSGWNVLATCPAAAQASSTLITVSTAPDTSQCAVPPTSTAHGRGWPVVPVVLPAAAGLDPSITKVSSDTRTRTVHVEYAVPSTAAGSTGGTVVAFVEVPPTALPDVPFTVEGANGPVTVSSVVSG